MSLGTHRKSAGQGLVPFDKTKVMMPDRVTTDVDNAVISSEDESELIKSVTSLGSQPGVAPASKPPRRTSFLSELQPDSKRKPSFTGFPGSGNGSQPVTPSTDTTVNPWGGIGSGLTRVPSNGATSAWSSVNQLWKDAPIGSPLAPSRSRGEGRSPLGTKDPLDDLIPFSIPLHPTPKTYRSQSYSVGQMEAELARANAGTVKHKPSRLNEVEHAPTLDEVHEGDDEGSDAGVPLGSPRLYNTALYSHLNNVDTSLPSDENQLRHYATEPSAMEYGASPLHSADPGAETAQGITSRPHWQTSLRMDRMDDGSFSRRHSLADVPTRRGSLAADAAPFNQNAAAYTREGTNESAFQQHAAQLENSMAQSDMHNRTYAQTYFSGTGPAVRSQIESTQPEMDFPIQRTLAGQNRQGVVQHVFGRPGYDTPLYIVAFKCARADIYYVQPSTGLEVNEGDLVMVEADRGYDLGTVTHARVSWTKARELKEKALDEHFRWLMMFSHHNQDLNAPDAQTFRGLLAQRGPKERDPMRATRDRFGMGANDAAYAHDIKPRMIKRRAFNHEIANLREKEGNEAKAKRACQQKAREHGCKMEILDAEFQIDWKKLTFYFYAEDYVNFNALVTDLYKVYKVRIWMSAINPQTYPSPANKPPSSIGPGAMEGRDTPMDQHVNPFNDPDPDGALPPSMNPNSNTYKELHREANEHQYLSQSGLNPSSDPFTSRLNADNVGFPRAADHHQSVNLQPPRNGNSTAWGGFPLPVDTPRSFNPRPGYQNSNNKNQGQATSGANFNLAISRPSPAPQNFASMGSGPYLGASGQYAAYGSPPGYPQPHQPWNDHGPPFAENRVPQPRLAPLPNVVGGSDWMRGFANMDLNQDQKK